MTDVEARVALGIEHFDLMKLAEKGTVRTAPTPYGLLFDPHEVNALRNQWKRETKESPAGGTLPAGQIPQRSR